MTSTEWQKDPFLFVYYVNKSEITNEMLKSNLKNTINTEVTHQH